MRSSFSSYSKIHIVQIDCAATIIFWTLLECVFRTQGQQHASFCYLLGGACSVVMVLALRFFSEDITRAKAPHFLTLISHLMHLVLLVLVVLCVVRLNEPLATIGFLVGFLQPFPLFLIKGLLFRDASLIPC